MSPEQNFFRDSINILNDFELRIKAVDYGINEPYSSTKRVEIIKSFVQAQLIGNQRITNIGKTLLLERETKCTI